MAPNNLLPAVTFEGTFFDSFGRLRFGSLESSGEVIRDLDELYYSWKRISQFDKERNPDFNFNTFFSSFRHRLFFVSNTAVYAVESGMPVLYFSKDISINPLLNNNPKELDKLITDNRYRLNKCDMQRVKLSYKAGQTKRFLLSELDLMTSPDLQDVVNFSFNPREYKKLNRSQKDLVKIVVYSNNLEKTMDLFTELDVALKIRLLSSSYLLEHAEECPIAMLSYLDFSQSYLVFSAVPQEDYQSVFSFRGIPRDMVWINPNELYDVLNKYVAPINKEEATGELKKLFVRD